MSQSFKTVGLGVGLSVRANGKCTQALKQNAKLPNPNIFSYTWRHGLWRLRWKGHLSEGIQYLSSFFLVVFLRQGLLVAMELVLELALYVVQAGLKLDSNG